ncbi:MAG: T9SS type A sorting domain-containing protein, partial [Chitinophaga rupis]
LQVDLDGKFTYSGIMSVKMPTGAVRTLRLTPNPTPGMIYLELENTDQGRLEVSLTDAAGRILHKWAFDKQGRQWTQSIDPGNLPAGTYFITIKGTKTSEVRSFIRSKQ